MKEVGGGIPVAVPSMERVGVVRQWGVDSCVQGKAVRGLLWIMPPVLVPAGRLRS